MACDHTQPPSPPPTSPILPHRHDPLQFQLFPFGSPLSLVSDAHTHMGLGTFITWNIGILLAAVILSPSATSVVQKLLSGGGPLSSATPIYAQIWAGLIL